MGVAYWQVCQSNPDSYVSECTAPWTITIPFKLASKYVKYYSGLEMVSIQIDGNLDKASRTRFELVDGKRIVQRSALEMGSYVSTNIDVKKSIKAGTRLKVQARITTRGVTQLVPLGVVKITRAY
jgi:hypothetical protein